MVKQAPVPSLPLGHQIRALCTTRRKDLPDGTVLWSHRPTITIQTGTEPMHVWFGGERMSYQLALTEAVHIVQKMLAAMDPMLRDNGLFRKADLTEMVITQAELAEFREWRDAQGKLKRRV